jgi:hypothetical protein
MLRSKIVCKILRSLPPALLPFLPYCARFLNAVAASHLVCPSRDES